jgi:hypothetical protein
MDNQSLTTSKLRIHNQADSTRKLFVEPWGDELLMPPDAKFEIFATGASWDCFEVSIGMSETVLYGPAQSTIRVTHLGETLLDYTTPTPPTPQR